MTFLDPYCTSDCPLVAAYLVGLERVLQRAQLANRVEFVTFNVDPSHTGPKTMAAFMRQYGWNPRDLHWQYLTGTPSQVRQVVTGGFHASYEMVPEAVAEQEAKAAEKQGLYSAQPQVVNPLARKADPGYEVTHSDALIVVDGRGRIRHVFQQGARVSDADMMSVIHALLQQR